MVFQNNERQMQHMQTRHYYIMAHYLKTVVTSVFANYKLSVYVKSLASIEKIFVIKGPKLKKQILAIVC
jgi:hypothetical protein